MRGLERESPQIFIRMFLKKLKILNFDITENNK